jgi:hypothetical protein
MIFELARRRLRDEDIPPRLRWLAAADGIAFWLWLVERAFGAELGDRERARVLLAEAAAPAWRRRDELLRQRWPHLGQGGGAEAPARWIKGLYPGPVFRAVDWISRPVGGPVRGLRGRRRATLAVAPIDPESRWQEVTVHLGELLVALTEGLPGAGIERAGSLLGQVCHDFGLKIGRLLKVALALPDGPASAIEVLRMSEYLFRVNPEHETGFDLEAGTGYIVGSACPWYQRPGWGGMHCGIFGRFQDGCCNAFGLDYRLKRTIPRHGGAECRVEMKPLSLRRRPA